MKKRLLLGPYSRLILRALWGSWGGGRFLVSEVPLHQSSLTVGYVLEFTVL